MRRPIKAPDSHGWLGCVLVALAPLGLSARAALPTAAPPPAPATLAAPAAPPARTVPAPVDRPYPGIIELEVDLTDLGHRVFAVRQRLPVAGPGPLTLLYPRWLPGNHAPTGPIQSFAGLVVTVPGLAGTRLEWQRDALNMYAFHLDVPEGARELELRFQFVSPSTAEQGRRTVSEAILGLQWEKALLYPAGYYARQVTLRPSIVLPSGWEFATAVRTAARDGDRVRFEPLSLEQLVDSPLFAGRHARRFELDADPRAPVQLHVFADRPAQLEATPAQLEAHRKLVRESRRLFGSRHYGRYDFLLALSDSFGGIGLEHHQSSENGVGTGYFAEWDATATVRDLLPHEFVHSWNGKFRRPADLWTPGFDVAMRNSLLWVYEGLTEYWGTVLAARSGLWSESFTRDALAHYAAGFDQARAGRQWRNLQDTTDQPILAYRVPLPFQSWQRSNDYYTEGVLLWLDVETKLRELTRDRRSLDDLARAFFGIRDGELGPLTYTFEDLVQALGAVAPFDWRAFLRERLDGHGPGAPLDGLARAGWRLVYRDTPSAFSRSLDLEQKRTSVTFSLGLVIAREGGRIVEVVWDSPAFKAGVSTGSALIAVNGRAFEPDELAEALRAAQRDGTPIELLVRSDEHFRTLRIDYRGGPRYPHLERVDGTPDRFTAVLKART